MRYRELWRLEGSACLAEASERVPENVSKSRQRNLNELTYHIRELHSILNEEDRQVNTHNIEIAFISVETSSHASDVSCKVSASSLAYDSREAYKRRRLLAFLPQERCSSDVGPVAI